MRIQKTWTLWPETIRFSGLYIYLPGMIFYFSVLKAKLIELLA
jgi:hypothetical protein